jgi:hypothetical protein
MVSFVLKRALDKRFVVAGPSDTILLPEDFKIMAFDTSRKISQGRVPSSAADEWKGLGKP